MKAKIKPWLVAVAWLLSAGFVITFLLIPLMNGLSAYNNYRQLSSSKQTVNANIRGISNQQAFLGFLNSCAMVIRYDFALNGQIFNGQDTINCSYDNALLVGNSIPVYYQPENPGRNVTNLSLGTKPTDLLSHSLFGLVGTGLIFGGWLMAHHRHQHSHQQRLNFVDY